MLETVDLSLKLERADYRKQLIELQPQLRELALEFLRYHAGLV